MVIAAVAADCATVFADDEDDFELVAQHIETWVDQGLLLCQGDPSDWRHSEIRRP